MKIIEEVPFYSLKLKLINSFFNQILILFLFCILFCSLSNSYLVPCLLLSCFLSCFLSCSYPVIIILFLSCSCTISAANEDQAPIKMQSGIKHIVVLMLENRSFDNVLAWLYDQGETPQSFIPSSTNPSYNGLSGNTLWLYTNFLTDSLGNIVFSSPPIKGVPSVKPGKYLNSPQYDPYEPFQNVTTQIYGIKGSSIPTMSGFLQDYSGQWLERDWLGSKKDICAVMETYTDNELPVLYGLAKHYAISDLWFSSVPSQTNPNRAFSICGTSEGQIVNGTLGKSLFQSDTIWNRLVEQSPQTTWKIFWQSDMVPILYPGPFTGTNTFASLNRIPNLDSYYELIDQFHILARNGQLPDFSYIEPQWTLSVNFDLLQRSPQAIYEFEAFLIGLQGNDLHPPGDVRTAENLLANIYTSLTSNTEAWNQTLLIITFDEHGGIFDHMPPPDAIAPDDNFQNGFNFDRYGVRVATLFISPLIDKSCVIRSDDLFPFDHTSLLATILKWKGIDKSLWNMGKRVNAAPTFENVITRVVPRQDPVIPSSTQTGEAVEGTDVVQMGDQFCLKDRNGNYLTKSCFFLRQMARVGSSENKVPLEFVSGTGNVTHGSFALIQSDDPELGIENFLGTMLSDGDCVYGSNKHNRAQWWTIKSVDNPQVGADINFGDKIYIENHVYLDLFEYVPGRLMQNDGVLGDFLMTQPITEAGSDDNWWIIERP